MEQFMERLKRYSDEQIAIDDMNPFRMIKTEVGYDLVSSNSIFAKKDFPLIRITNLSNNEQETELLFTFSILPFLKRLFLLASLFWLFMTSFHLFQYLHGQKDSLREFYFGIFVFPMTLVIMGVDFHWKVKTFTHFIERLGLLVEKEG
ncbi:MAG: hypothetical protein ACKVOK_13140 [Flavobacteriales bacterium]